MIKEIVKQNPIFSLTLGMCSALAVTTTFENAYMMGICLTIVLLFSNIIVSLIRKIIPENVKIPVYILIISTFVTIIELLLNEYIPALSKSLGIYLPLIVVNCIVLGRALSVASKSNVKTSIKDAFIIGIGYTFALMAIALIREILGSGTITLMDNLSAVTGYREIIRFKQSATFPMSLYATPAGAFITIGVLLALINKIREGKNETN